MMKILFKISIMKKKRQYGMPKMHNAPPPPDRFRPQPFDAVEARKIANNESFAFGEILEKIKQNAREGYFSACFERHFSQSIKAKLKERGFRLIADSSDGCGVHPYTVIKWD
jgi:hypothetical protein